MQRKNQTYTLLEDSDSEGDAPKESQKSNKKEKDRGSKRRHIRQKKDSESSEDEPPKKYVLEGTVQQLSHFVLLNP